MRVLIIDDDEVILHAMETLLNIRGYHVTAIRSSLQIEDIVKQYRPDIVLMDVMMPLYDGCTACRQLRMLGYNLPIVLFSASPLANKLKAACGADGFIAKPFFIEDIIAEIERLSAANVNQ